MSIKPEVISSSSKNTDYFNHQYGSDDKSRLDIKLEPCCEMCNPSKISINPSRSGSDDKVCIKTDTIQSDNQAQNFANEMHIKIEVDNDSDVEVDLVYKIIDTSNFCEVETFKREDEKILPDTKPLLKINETQLRVEVDNKIDLGYDLTNQLNVCDKEETALKNVNVDYDNLNLEDYVNKQPVHQLQSKGM